MPLEWLLTHEHVLFFSFHRMYGLFQTVFYFGYMALASIALGILCGKICAAENIHVMWMLNIVLCMVHDLVC